jgi:hypothetical protein
VVQNSLPGDNLGVATASHQFSRTLGGTIGIGISGSFVTARLKKTMDLLMPSGISDQIPRDFSTHLQQSAESLFRPEVQSLLSANVQKALQGAVAESVTLVFWAALIMSCVCLVFSYRLPKRTGYSLITLT